MIADPDAPLIAGGASDPNIVALLHAFRRRGAAAQRVLVGGEVPAVVWEPIGGGLIIDGIPRTPRAIFLRRDVFGSICGPDPRLAACAAAWTAALVGWLLANPSVRAPNRSLWSSVDSKPAALVLAHQVGLRTPATVVTNDRAAAGAFLDGRDPIARPVAGGGVTGSLDDAVAMASRSDGPFAAPALLQERLVAPEVRVYVVGDRTFAFEVRSPHRDHRAASDAEVVALDAAPDEVAAPLVRVAAAMGLPFCAADFQTARDGALCFLEIDPSPRFARFDQAAGGRLCDALVDWLCA